MVRLNGIKYYCRILKIITTTLQKILTSLQKISSLSPTFCKGSTVRYTNKKYNYVTNVAFHAIYGNLCHQRNNGEI